MNQRRTAKPTRLTAHLRPAKPFLALLLTTCVIGWLALISATHVPEAAASAPPISGSSSGPDAKTVPQTEQPVLVGHVNWQGRPSQPHPLQSLPLTLTLELSSTATLYSNLTTDAGGFFTVTLGSMPVGNYTWWAKGPQFLAVSGNVNLNGAPTTSVEMGTQQVGDASTDNLIDIGDFSILRASFGKSVGNPGYDARADFNGDNTVDITDFSLMRGNFGRAGPPMPTNAAPPDPSIVAPPLDRSVATDLANATQFLYSGPSPIQTGVITGTIEITRVAVLRGKVLDRAGQPLPMATVKVLGHPEFGQTLSRVDGMFDMAVNGGGQLTVTYHKDGYLPVQRDVEASWQNYEQLPDVVMIPLDTQVTAIDLASTTPIQVARASRITDADGSRQETLLFQAGTTSVMTMSNGTTQPLTVLNVRSTEYTVGDSGPAAMPGDLPANSGYTFATEFTVDEAEAAGAVSVGFSQPVVSYQENFLNFPVGIKVPMGYYDKIKGQWISSTSGRVIKILSITAGLAELDTDGDNQVDNGAALGVTAAERQTLATLYQSGQTLWRVPVDHFSPWDKNWGIFPPFDFIEWLKDIPERNIDNQCQKSGSIIGCENQTLGEAIGIAGTGHGLYYSSDRVPGRSEAYTKQIPLSGANIPASLQGIEMEIMVAGQRFAQRFPGAPNQIYNFTWDGKDVYGRTVQGTQPLTVKVGYAYQGVYQQTDRFGYNGNGTVITGSQTREELIVWKEWQGTIGAWDANPQGLGGWTLDAHHTYDTVGRALYMGDGTKRSVQSLGHVVTRAAGTGGRCNYASDPNRCGDGGPARDALVSDQGLATGPDGSLYIAGGNVIRKVNPNGIITTIAGTGVGGYNGDNIPALQAQLNDPMDIAVAPDGSVYFVDKGNQRIRRVAPNGIINTVAGNGIAGFSGDGGDARLAQLNHPESIAIGPDGSLYISDGESAHSNHRIRRVGTDGIISTIAGNGALFGCPGRCPAPSKGLAHPTAVDVAPDGTVYISTLWFGGVYRLTPDGMIDLVPGTEGRIGDVAVGPDGSVYFTRDGLNRISPTGAVVRVVGGGNASFSEGTPPNQLASSPGTVEIGPDGYIYFFDAGLAMEKLLRSGPALATFDASEQVVASADGSQLYIFSASGRHLRTQDAVNGVIEYQFGYDAAGRLVTITDIDGLVTTVQRDQNGNPLSILAPNGQTTTLNIGADGYLASISNPAQETVRFTYNAGGLMASMTDPKGGVYRFTYDNSGRLIRDENPAGAVQTLARAFTANGYTITVSTGMGRTSTYSVEQLPNGDVRRVTVDPSGARSETLVGKNGTSTTTAPDGTVLVVTMGPDPRWGMLAPVARSFTTSSAGRQSVMTVQRAVSLSNPNDKMSLTSMTETITVNGRVSTVTYNAGTRTITTTSAEGRTSTTRLDAKGRVVEQQVPGMATVTYTYDARGLLRQMNQGVRSTSYLYDAQDRLVQVTDPLSRVTRLTYDAANRVTSSILPDGRQITYAYDANDNTTSLTPPGRPAHTFSHTSGNLLDRYSPPSLGQGETATQYSYNADQQSTLVTRPDGQTIGFSYDVVGRLSTLNLPNGQNLSYSYAPVTGKLAQVGAPGGTLVYSHTGMLLTQQTSTGAIQGNLSWTYDNDFRVTSTRINATNPITYTYDRDSHLTGAGALTMTRSTQNGFLTGTTLGTTTTGQGYNSFGEVSTYSAVYSGTSLFSTTYTRDNLGRIAEKTESVGAETLTYAYTYDISGRLTGVRRDGTTISTYTYDANGNRLSHTGPDGTLSGTYDNQDRLNQYGGTTYTYTANGELTSKITDGQTTTYTYDVLGNLTSATLPDATQVTYVVDGQNRRIGKRVNGAPVQGFLYEGQLRPMAELDGSSNIVSRFVYASKVNVPDYMVKNGVTYRIISDHLGSPRLVVDTGTGNIVQRVEYDEFGNITADSNPGFQPFGFAGGLYDQHTKLTRFGARDYDAHIARWTAKDPIGFAGGDTNLYGYVLNDPINLADLTGENPMVIAGALAGGALGGYNAWQNGCSGRDIFFGVATGAVGGAVGGLGVGWVSSVLWGIRGEFLGASLNYIAGGCGEFDVANMLLSGVGGGVVGKVYTRGVHKALSNQGKAYAKKYAKKAGLDSAEGGMFATVVGLNLGAVGIWANNSDR